MPRSLMSRSSPTIARSGALPKIFFANSTLPRRPARLLHVKTLTVELGDRSYPILIGESLLRQPDLARPHLQARDILIVSNTTVAPLYLKPLTAVLSGARVVEALLPDGESHKTLTTVARILDVLVANR